MAASTWFGSVPGHTTHTLSRNSSVMNSSGSRESLIREMNPKCPIGTCETPREESGTTTSANSNNQHCDKANKEV